MLLLGDTSATAATKSVWELTPYRIQVLVAVAPSPELTGSVQTSLLADLVARTDALVGAPWILTAAPVPRPLQQEVISLQGDRKTTSFSPLAAGPAAVETEHQKGDSRLGALTAHLARLSANGLPRPPEFDKLILLSVTPAEIGWTVTARDLDMRTQLFGTPVSMSVRQLAKLRDVAVDAVLEAFAPLALVERPEKDRVTLRLRAGALPCRDEALAFIQPGDVLRPVIRYNDRQGNPRRILPVPWTFCTVQRVAAERLHCRLESGLRSPLSGRRRGRVQRFALAVGTPRGPTVLTLQSQSEPAEGLEGYTIYSRGSNSDVPTLLGRTDRRGRITVPPAPGLVRVLLVQSGSEPLARLPIVPGLEPELTVRVPDDSERLEAEGVATGLQEQLLDLVARREVMLARAKAHLQARELAKAQTLIDALQGLPNQGDFRRTLASRKNSSYSDDPAVQAKIDKLFQRVENSIAKHLQPGPIESLRQQLRTAQGQAGS